MADGAILADAGAIDDLNVDAFGGENPMLWDWLEPGRDSCRVASLGFVAITFACLKIGSIAMPGSGSGEVIGKEEEEEEEEEEAFSENCEFENETAD